MTNLSKDFMLKLSDNFTINAIKQDKTQFSNDGTIKSRYRLHDGHLIETVLIPVPVDNRFTVCVSTQVGCSLTCTFCATGRMGRIRNLDASEIYDQFVAVNRQSLEVFDHPLTNIVYMGMGEPLLNYANTLKSVPSTSTWIRTPTARKSRPISYTTAKKSAIGTMAIPPDRKSVV